MSATLEQPGTRLFPKITEAALDDLRTRIGKPIENTAEPWCYEATRDNIRHYAHGIGDDNPLWCDPDYARTTRHGGMARGGGRDQPIGSGVSALAAAAA